MKRLLLFILFFAAVQSSLMLTADDSQFWRSQQFRVPEQMGPAPVSTGKPPAHFFPSQQVTIPEGIGPAKAPAGKQLAPELIENAGTAAIKVLANYFGGQILELKRAAKLTKDYQSAVCLYDQLHTLYTLIKAQPDGAYLIDRLRIEMGGIKLNDQLFAEYEQAVASLRNK